MKSKITHVASVAVFMCFLFTSTAFAQINTPRGSQKATVSQTVGITNISVTYSRPSVRGREIWGKLVPYGMNNFGFGTAKESPWRAGADENTVITFSNDVKIEGKPIKAGTYGLHMEVKENGSVTLIFSNNSTSWGSYFYEPSEDALRVEVQSKEIPTKELLTFDFIEVKPNSTTLALQWEKKEIPFAIEVDVTTIVLANIRKTMQDQLGFNRQTWEDAAAFSLNNGGDLDEALAWINNAIAGQFYSQQTFANTQIKAAILMKQGKNDEALAAIDQALPLATVIEIHQYGRQLLAQKMNDRAMEIFTYNAKKHKGTWPVHYGMARAYSAKGDFKPAIKHLKKALENAPNAASKSRVQANLDKLKKGEAI
ncbi:hypothetical protein IMCC3317_02070 [Kordia antarctica]|uniref:Beta-barrel assembly-enhancing protease n=1 Tax=Kordia antarctica TaxID=1218801 RepID=A0A7L4ZDI1_9FLAO|nr:DUF2911 domain-containing protein [Kordia antarctica]QHI34862.1 hypothetical protein IMCC3317_02070 [Kordia antarctica]